MFFDPFGLAAAIDNCVDKNRLARNRVKDRDGNRFESGDGNCDTPRDERRHEFAGIYVRRQIFPKVRASPGCCSS
jgi:hypothetical protein